MKITGIQTFLMHAGWRNWLFVKVATDEGIDGLGEAALAGRELTVETAMHELGRYLVGKDPRDIERHWALIQRNAFWPAGAVLSTALSAVEQAMWDILGKSLNIPLYRLLGGKCRDAIPVYANGWFGGCFTPDAFAERALETVNRGYKALKWDPFDFCHAYMDLRPADFEQAIECVRAVRQAVGASIGLAIEGHGRFNPQTALKIADAIAEFDPLWFEEPVPPENLAALESVTAASPVPIASGERLYTKWAFRDLLERRAAHVIQPDICNAGGLLETKKIAAMAEVDYVAIAPHNPNGPISIAANLHFAASTPNFQILELPAAEDDLRSSVCRTDFTLNDGCLPVPEAPGLGVELDIDGVNAHPYQAVELNMYGDCGM